MDDKNFTAEEYLAELHNDPARMARLVGAIFYPQNEELDDCE